MKVSELIGKVDVIMSNFSSVNNLIPPDNQVARLGSGNPFVGIVVGKYNEKFFRIIYESPDDEIPNDFVDLFERLTKENPPSVNTEIALFILSKFDKLVSISRYITTDPSSGKQIGTGQLIAEITLVKEEVNAEAGSTFGEANNQQGLNIGNIVRKLQPKREDNVAKMKKGLTGLVVSYNALNDDARRSLKQIYSVIEPYLDEENRKKVGFLISTPITSPVQARVMEDNTVKIIDGNSKQVEVSQDNYYL